MMSRKYHGWIYAEKCNGLKDYFSVHWRDETGEARHKPMGHGKAAEAVDFFETECKLGHVMLEQTPIGLRVYTDE